MNVVKSLELLVDVLKAEFPGISFGYIGNVDRWGDDRSWYVFLPHPGRVGTMLDRVGGYSTDRLPDMLAGWDGIVAIVRKRMIARGATPFGA